MLVLGIDFETTGLDTDKDRIIEVGAVLWCTRRDAPLSMLSCYMHAPDYPRLTDEIQSLTGILPDDLEQLHRPPRHVFDELHRLVQPATAIVAHNGTKFDRPLFAAELVRQGRDFNLWDRPWLDTSVDVPYPERVSTRKLTHLAAEHAFVNPFPHRALFDVLTMLTVLSRYDFAEVCKLSLEPSVELVARTQKPWDDGGASTTLAKARGYRWDGARKQWTKIVKKCHVERELSHKEFPVTVLEKAI